MGSISGFDIDTSHFSGKLSPKSKLYILGLPAHKGNEAPEVSVEALLDVGGNAGPDVKNSKVF